MELRIPNKIAINLSVIGVVSVGLLGYGLISVFAATKQPEVVAEAVTKCDSSWLLSEEPSSVAEYNEEQMRLFLFNQDPSACKTGLVFGLIDQAAQQMIGQVSLATQAPKNSCFKLSQSQCLYKRFEQLEKALEQAKTPLDKSAVVAQLAALNRAIDAVRGKVVLGTGGESESTIALLIQRSRQNAQSEHSESVEGQSAEEIKKRAQDKQAAEDAEKGFSLSDEDQKGRDDRRDKKGGKK